MGEITGLLVVLAVGVPLLGVAVLLDWRRRRRMEGTVSDRGDQQGRPRYLTQSDIDALPRPSRGTSSGHPTAGTRLPFGYASPDFATTGDRAEYRNVRVLVVDGDISGIRELMVPLARHRPLVIVARGVEPEVLATLVANRKALDLPVLAAVTSEPAVAAEHSGAEMLGLADLRAGYVPEHALGRAAVWASNLTHTWLVHADEK